MQPHIVIPWSLTTLDWVVFVTILIVTLASVFYGHYLQKKSQENESFLELLLMGRRLTLPLFIATLVATWYGGIVGVTSLAFEKGLFNFVTQGFFWYLTYLLFAFFIVHKVRNLKSRTLAESLEEFFGPKSRKVAAVLNFINVLPLAYAISGGVLIQLIFGIHLHFGILLSILFVVLYSSFGGLRSVVFSDLIQFFVMCSSVLLVIIFSISEFGGISFLQSKLPESYFKLTGDETLMATVVWGVIALTTLVDPNFHQRALAANSTPTAKKGIIISTCIWVVFDLCTTFGAMYAKALIPTAEANQAYMIYSIQLLPEGLKGYFLAGMLATIFSTMDSYFFIASTSVSYDLLPAKLRNIKNYTPILFLIAIITGVFAISFDGKVYEVWKIMGSLSASCLLVPMCFAYWKPGILKDRDFLISAFLGAFGVGFSTITEIMLYDPIYSGLLTSSFGVILGSYRYLKVKNT